MTANMAANTTHNPTLRIEVFSDVACPWCYLGDTRLREALARAEVQAVVHWQPFQLQPALPPGGVPWKAFAERKFGSWARALEVFAQVGERGREAGLTFRFTDIARANNTVDAHRLILYAEAYGKGEAAARALYQAYFAEGKDLNDTSVLVRLMATLGLEPDAVRAFLRGDEKRPEVAASQERAATLGITGVPFYIFNERFGVSGAQPVETFVSAVDQALNGAVL